MRWIGPVLKALPALVSLIMALMKKKGGSSERAEEILGDKDEPLEAEKARKEARRKADEKFMN